MSFEDESTGAAGTTGGGGDDGAESPDESSMELDVSM